MVDRGDPVPHRLVHRVLERLGAGLDGDHVRAEQPHPGHVERLPLGVHLAHVDGALQPEERGRRGRGHAVLAGPGLGDHPGLAHPPGEQGLAEHVVDLVRAGVVQVLALEHDDRSCPEPVEPAWAAKRCASVTGLGPPGVVGEQPGQLGAEAGIGHGGARTPAPAAGARRTAPRGRTCRRTGRSGRWHPAGQKPTRRPSRTCAGPGERRPRPGRPPPLGVATGDQRLADQDHVGAGASQLDHVVRAAYAGLGDPDDPVGDQRGQPGEGRRLDLEGLQVAGVDADHRGAGVHGPLDLVGGVRLDQRGEPDRAGPLDQRDQLGVGQRGHDQQDQVGAGRPGLEELVGGDDEVLAQHRHRHREPHPDQVVQRAGEPALLGEHRDGGRSPGLVLLGQRGGIGDLGQRALARAGPLDLRDHRHARARTGPASGSSAGSTCWQRSFSRSSGTRRCRCARSSRTPAMMSSSAPTMVAPVSRRRSP